MRELLPNRWTQAHPQHVLPAGVEESCQARELRATAATPVAVPLNDACFAADGCIFVAEWVATGRVTKLKKV